MLKIDRNDKGFRRIQSMAATCFRSKESLDLNSPYGMANVTASGFVVRTLYEGKNTPINENRLLKALRNNKVFMPQSNISELLLELHVSGVVHPMAKGYVLTDSMMELIGEYLLPKEEENAAGQN